MLSSLIFFDDQSNGLFLYYIGTRFDFQCEFNRLRLLQNDELNPKTVIPAQAGIHNRLNLQHWIPDKSTRE